MKLKIFCGVGLIVLVGCEFWLRDLHSTYRKESDAKLGSRDWCTQPAKNPKLIYEGRENRCETNAQGFFDYDYSFEKPIGTKRIIVIGDSVALGQGVAMGGAFPKLIEAALKDQQQRVQVITLAFTGYSTVQLLELLKNEAFRYSPDLVLWTHHLNDPAHPVFHDANGQLGRYYIDPPIYVWYGVKYLWFKTVEVLKKNKCPRDYHTRIHCEFEGQMRDYFKEIALVATKRKVPTALFVLPVRSRGRSYPLKGLHRNIEAMALESRLDIIRSEGILLPNSPLRNPSLWIDVWHPNGEGHRAIADYLLPPLSKVLVKVAARK